MKAKDLPQYYTAREVSEAFTNLLSAFVRASDEQQLIYAKLMASVANGDVACLGIVDSQFVCGSPKAACWLGRPVQ